MKAPSWFPGEVGNGGLMASWSRHWVAVCPCCFRSGSGASTSERHPMLRHRHHRRRSATDTALLPFRYLAARVRVALVHRAALRARAAP